MLQATEFIGAEKGNQTMNPTPELRSEDCSPTSRRCLTRDQQMHYLSLVKPRMIQKVLSRRGFSEERKAESIGNHGDMEGSREVPLMELFPQRPGFDTCLTGPSHHSHLTGKSAQQLQVRSLVTPFGVVGAQTAVSRTSASHATAPQKQPSAQLSIFYNGTVNVYDLPTYRAQAIMKILGDNWNAHQSNAGPEFDEGVSCRPTSGSLNRTPICKATPTSNQDEMPAALPTPKKPVTAQKIKETENLHRAELPLARRQSLQRFIEKRQIRLNSVTPYPKSATLVNKAGEDKMEQPLNCPLQS